MWLAIGIYMAIGALAATWAFLGLRDDPESRLYAPLIAAALSFAWPLALAWLIYAVSGTVLSMILGKRY